MELAGGSAGFMIEASSDGAGGGSLPTTKAIS
jgi:hypothetical protein